MNITQIRNATLLITYAGKRLLIDPMLAPKDAYPGFPGTAHAERRNPTVELPVDVNTLLNADADHAYDVAVGDRIAQLIVMPVPRARFIPVDELPDTVRGAGGFGSTGYQAGGAS